MIQRFINWLESYATNGVALLTDKEHKQISKIKEKSHIDINTPEDLREIAAWGVKMRFSSLNKTLWLFGSCFILQFITIGISNRYELPGNVNIIGIFPVMLVLYICSHFIRKYAYGLHLPKRKCIIFGNVGIFIGYLFSVLGSYSVRQKVLIFLICFILMAAYAPQGTEIQKVKAKNYKRLKIKTLITISVIFALSFFADRYYFKAISMIKTEGHLYYLIGMLLFSPSGVSNAFIYAIIQQAVNMLPLTYKLFGEHTVKPV